MELDPGDRLVSQGHKAWQSLLRQTLPLLTLIGCAGPAEVAMTRVVKIVLISTLVGVPALLVADQTVGKGLSWRDMDWNDDGHTSLGEVADAFNVDVRPVKIEGKQWR